RLAAQSEGAIGRDRPFVVPAQDSVEDHGRRNSPSRSTASMKVAHSDRVKRTEPEFGLLELRTSTTSSTRRTSTHCPFVPLRVGLCHRSFSAAILRTPLFRPRRPPPARSF